MKKLIAAALTAFLMSFGLVATSSSPAAAACPYSGCIATDTNAAPLKTKASKKARLYARVTSFGNGRPEGSLTFTFVKRNGKSFEFTRPYPSPRGQRFVYSFKPLTKGAYSVIVTFVPSDDSAYEGSSDRVRKLVVKAPRRR